MYSNDVARVAGLCLIAIILTAATAAPAKTSNSMVPSWHLLCDEDFELNVSSSENSKEELKINLGPVKLQIQLTMTNYENYKDLYERDRIGDHQYISNWLPGQNDTNLVRRLVNANSQTIVNYFPKLHTDLQKFAVAFEQLIKDETDPNKSKGLRSTQSYLMKLLCEVESILTLASLQLPNRIEKSIMSSIERNPVDDTRRLVRDWGVLSKYEHYLQAWFEVLN
ncbi:hypothetical protein HN011_000778 [Eciton burchellii]|nr:hypothetical protein HN011_000778 [Eciton burchellii]